MEPYVWDSFARDIAELVEELALEAAIGVGHSMGGHCLVQVAASHPSAFNRLLLVDPVIFEPDAYTHDRYRGFAGPEDHPVSKRKNDWENWQEMYERFKNRGSFALWDDRVLVDYCRYGVLPTGDGRFELACPPLVESSIYLGNTSTDIYQKIPHVHVPVTVLRARGRDPDEHAIMDFSLSPTWAAVAEQFEQGTDVYLPELSHFMPMQDPGLVARYIAAEPQDD
jgi:pimeloyl-ACP methyl ester carboxylesterase